MNHDLFFKVMSPNGADEPEARRSGCDREAFGSVSSFKQLFTANRNLWLWLGMVGVRPKSRASAFTANQDTPVRAWCRSLAWTWEHASPQAPEQPKGYVDAFWLVVNWDEVASRLEKARQGKRVKAARLGGSCCATADMGHDASKCVMWAGIRMSLL